MSFVIEHSYLIPLLPLIGAAAAGFFGARHLRHNSHWPIWIGVGASAVLSIVLLVGMLSAWREKAHLAHDATHAGGESNVVTDEDSAASAGADNVIEAEEEPALYRSPTLAFRKFFYTWIRAGEREAPQLDAAGRLMFDESGREITARRPAFVADAAFFFDPLTAVMLCVICGIGFLITVFAKGYMAGEEGYFRFFAYLGLFIFMMTVLVMGDNLVMLYLGWEGVGLCSYLLIGYYYDKPTAREAAKKAFLVNRVGDFGFGLGIMYCFLAFGTVSYFGDVAVQTDGLLEVAAMAANPHSVQLSDFQANALKVIPFLLMLGAFGKSAQFPLHVWLPDAMEGPTPVSALIHAATMVTAGIYMIVRCSTLFFSNEAAMTTIAVIGAFTAVMAATIALRQFDLKKVFAYSTISQLGFMFVGVGVLAPVAGVFHLVTHAFFKALLFLSSGVVMHAMAGVLDMRQMSGLKRVLPWTHWFMLVGCLALAGVPLFSGFFSKDEILAAAMDRSMVLGLIMLFAAFLTAYYTFKLYFRVFQGPLVIPQAAPPAHAPEVDEHLVTDHAHHGHAVDDAHGHGHGHGHGDHHNHEPLSMMVPLAVLAIGAFAAGYLNWPHREASIGHFLGYSPSFVLGFSNGGPTTPSRFGMHERGGMEHDLVEPIMLVSGFVALLGIALAYMMHMRDRTRAERLAAGLAPLTRAVEAKYWVDEIYQNGIVEPLRAAGRAFFAIDRLVVDGIVNAFGWVPQVFGQTLRLTMQRGYLQGYAAAMLFGIAVILLIIFL